MRRMVGIANYFHFVFSLTVYMNVGLCYMYEQTKRRKRRKKPDENTLFVIYEAYFFPKYCQK